MDKMTKAGKIKGLLFDKDGTLFDFYRTWVPILEEGALMAAWGNAALVPDLMRACGFDPSTGRAVSGGVLAAGDTPDLARIWAGLVPGWKVDDLIAALDARFTEEGPRRSQPVTELVPYFGGLRAQGYRTGIATNDSAASVVATVAQFGLNDHIEFACGYNSGFGAKPAPGMAHAFCAAVDLSPSEIAMVGDNFHDLEMGRLAGVGLKVGVLTGTSEQADLAPHADIILDSIVDLPVFLSKL